MSCATVRVHVDAMSQVQHGQSQFSESHSRRMLEAHTDQVFENVARHDRRSFPIRSTEFAFPTAPRIRIECMRNRTSSHRHIPSSDSRVLLIVSWAYGLVSLVRMPATQNMSSSADINESAVHLFRKHAIGTALAQHGLQTRHVSANRLQRLNGTHLPAQWTHDRESSGDSLIPSTPPSFCGSRGTDSASRAGRGRLRGGIAR